jgi:NAD(P)-dependent dehydrogenase (short-subunit alcohol dehydrogenase family)
MKFSEQQLSTFAQLSHDINPLHLDEQYARSTPFGSRVFYGCAAVLWALGHWANGRIFQLEFIKVNFKKPLFLNEEYQVQIEESGRRVFVRIRKNSSIRMSLNFTWIDRPFASIERRPKEFDSLSAAKAGLDFRGRIPEILEEARRYQMDADAIGRLRSDFGLQENQMPMHQMEVICWASYLVGMQIPGRQALFTNFEFNFDNKTTTTRFSLDTLTAELHEQFNHIEIAGAGTGVTSFSIVSWVRPEAVRFDLSDLQVALGTSDNLIGKTVLVTGASRGLGSVLARAFALHGADVVINYLSNATEALCIKRDIESLGRKATLAQGDISSSRGVDAVLSTVRNNAIEIDILINNALPPPVAAGLSEQSEEDVLAYVTTALGMTVRTCYGLTQVLKPGGIFLTVSSIFVIQPEPKFSAYTTAKGAIESWIRAFASETPSTNFVIVRPPRMLTDITNSPQSSRGYAPVTDVACAIIRGVTLGIAPGNMTYLDVPETQRKQTDE